MSEWYYAKGGQQLGPVGFEKLRELVSNGELDPAKDLVWTSTMKDWLPAGQVEGLMGRAATSHAADSANPYAAPQTGWDENAALSADSGDLQEIEPGSQQIDAAACIKRGWELVKRNAVMIVLVGLIYFGASFALGMVTGIINTLVAGTTPPITNENGEITYQVLPITMQVITQIVTQVFSTFLGLGVTRIGLNLVSGREASVGMMFGEGRKLLRALGATILFSLMVLFGLVLLIAPGIYLALRFGQYMTAIVDKDLGVIESLKYSSSITTNNRMNLFVLWIFSFLLGIAGLLACIVGVFVAIPIVWLAALVAYRWLQYGNRAAMDHPGTTTPMLAPR